MRNITEEIVRLFIEELHDDQVNNMGQPVVTAIRLHMCLDWVIAQEGNHYNNLDTQNTKLVPDGFKLKFKHFVNSYYLQRGE